MNIPTMNYFYNFFGMPEETVGEELTEENFVIPENEDYDNSFNDEEYEIEVASLWENIRKKKEREGKNYRPARPGEKDRPDPEAFKKAQSSEYQGKKVTLNKPFRTPKGPKKFAVYTKNESGKVVIVRFGDPNMSIKKNDPERKKSFRARHKCDTNPGPKWKARYWSCRMWE